MAPPSVLMVGTGEYTTGYVGGTASTSDKKVGVVGLTLFDLRRRGKVGNLSMVGVSGRKFPGIRSHLQKNISEVYNGLDVSFTSYPADDQTDPDAYKAAIDALEPGSAITIFTPDPTHFPIALYAIQRKIHVLITKPATQLLSDHLTLLEEARKHGVFVFIEHHKRFDPAYSDARAKARNLGDFNYFYSYMSQPKSQLETFKAWAGKDSDISYYLNSHHIDINESMVPEYAPVKVTASASKDMGSKGEVRINQAKRGYDVTEDEQGLIWVNPFYMRYAPDEDGNFSGQTGYGYISFEKFIDAVTAVNEGRVTLDQLDARPLPTLKNTIATTAILHAGRISLDERRPVEIVNEGDKWELK
ncbi:hypothetical protein APSETT444_003815 [Aspergillus pseudonomiae]